MDPCRSWSCTGSDSEPSSLSSPETLSPFMDSSLSPSYRRPPGSVPRQGPDASSRRTSGTGWRSGRGAGTRSKQRENASEKEKMRMRDLTKALHHLRSFLPPSVAPRGQTLTKIETLRLTIRYIGQLSAQLGRDASSPDLLGYLGSSVAPWARGPSLDQNQSPGHAAAVHAGSYGLELQYKAPYGEAPGHALNTEDRLQARTTQQYCQMFDKEGFIPLVPRDYWG